MLGRFFVCSHGVIVPLLYQKNYFKISHGYISVNERKKRNKSNPRVAKTHIMTHTKESRADGRKTPFYPEKTILETCNGILFQDLYNNLLYQLGVN